MVHRPVYHASVTLRTAILAAAASIANACGRTDTPPPPRFASGRAAPFQERGSIHAAPSAGNRNGRGRAQLPGSFRRQACHADSE